jgi:hypothetical protein
MPKPRLRLVYSSNDAQPGAVPRPSERSFRPSVIHGSLRARSAPEENSWEAAVELINLAFMSSCRNYAAFVQASMAVLEACNAAEFEKPGR